MARFRLSLPDLSAAALSTSRRAHWLPTLLAGNKNYSYHTATVSPASTKGFYLPPEPKPNSDAAEAVRYLAIKAAIFIGVPALAAIVAVFVML